VRLKRYLEMRGADSGPWRRLCALPAFWVGLLYSQSALDAAWDLVKDWTVTERQSLRDDVPRQALEATIKGRSVRDVARDTLQIARSGLENRDMQGCKGNTESSFLNTLDETVATGKTSADILLELYNTTWNRDITRVFRDFAY
jgi:glutamate--cysteine ligase